MDVTLHDNSGSIMQRFGVSLKAALDMVGSTAEGYAKLACPVDTGHLRKSISHAVQDKTVHVGTNVEYAPYVELGTGRHATGGGGTLVTFDKDGNAHAFNGQAAQPYLKPAIADHIDEYKSMLGCS